MADAKEVFTSGGCLGSLQQWWTSRQFSEVGDVKGVFRSGGVKDVFQSD